MGFSFVIASAVCEHLQSLCCDKNMRSHRMNRPLGHQNVLRLDIVTCASVFTCHDSMHGFLLVSSAGGKR